MKRIFGWFVPALLAIALAASLAVAARAEPQTPIGRIAQRRAAYTPWCAPYYETMWGSPVALVVPPCAGMHTEYHWGVTGTRINTIYHQYRRGFPGYGYGAMVPFRPTPKWPSDTNQFGVYYIRAPW